MRKEGTRMNAWDYSGAGDVKQGKREIQAKIKVQEQKITQRVALTKQQTQQSPSESAALNTNTNGFNISTPLASKGTMSAAAGIPRLEVLAERLHLDFFEKMVVMMIIGKTVSPVVR